jgi:hypothetical protein
MQTVNIHEATTHLSRLVEETAKGNVVTIQHLFQNDCHSRGFNRENEV